jgi:quercetin dioxygenase-like cupin family protein
MQVVRHDDAETYEPEAGWERRALAGSDRFTFEWFTKPAGHSSPMHDHENEQVCVVLKGELTLHAEDGSSTTLEEYDSAWIPSWETHAVENEGDERAIGLDVFAPGRSFDFWTDRVDDE